MIRSCLYTIPEILDRNAIFVLHLCQADSLTFMQIRATRKKNSTYKITIKIMLK